MTIHWIPHTIHDHFVTIVMNGVCSYSSASLGASELHIVLVLLPFWNLGSTIGTPTGHDCVYPGLYIMCTLFYCLVDARWRVFSGAGGSKGLFCCYVVWWMKKRRKYIKGFYTFQAAFSQLQFWGFMSPSPGHQFTIQWKPVMNELWMNHDRVTKDPLW